MSQAVLNSKRTYTFTEMLSHFFKVDDVYNLFYNSYTVKKTFGSGSIKIFKLNKNISYCYFKFHMNEDFVLNISEVNPLGNLFLFCQQQNLHGCLGEIDFSIKSFQQVFTNQLTENDHIAIDSFKTVEFSIINMSDIRLNKDTSQFMDYDVSKLSAFLQSNDNTVVYKHGDLKLFDLHKKIRDLAPISVLDYYKSCGLLNEAVSLTLEDCKNSLEQFEIDNTNTLSQNELLLFQKFLTYIDDHITENFTIEFVSKHIGLSQKKLQLGMKLYAEKTINEYIRDTKLEKSIELLESRNYNISEVVYKIGFKSRSYFSKIFFERYGIVPKLYRRSLRK